MSSAYGQGMTSLYSAPFYLNISYQIWFSSLKDWRRYLKSLEGHFGPDKPAVFYCNPNALGPQYQKNRTTNQDHNLWRFSTDRKSGWLPSEWDTTVPFTVAHQWILDRKKKSKFPLVSFGALSIYLFTADLHAAGIVQMPSPAEMGKIIRTLGKGALGTLRRLGYVSRQGNMQESVQGFVQFFEDVRACLSEEEVQDLPWNPIVAEHTLCKLGRMNKKGYYK